MPTLTELMDNGTLRPFQIVVGRPTDRIWRQVVLTADAEAFLQGPPAGANIAHYLDGMDILRATLESYIVGRSDNVFEYLDRPQVGIGKFSCGPIRLAGWRQTEHVVIGSLGYMRCDVVPMYGGYSGIKARISDTRRQLDLGQHFRGA